MNKNELNEKYKKITKPNEWKKTNLIATLVCTFFGSGMSPKAPGTFGSFAATIFIYPYAILCYLYPIKIFNNLIHINFFITSIIIFFISLPFVNKAMKDTKTKDPGWIVIDEVCGIFVTFSLIKPEIIINNTWIILLGFILFRFFDILKPLGIHKIENLPNAWGVMADDFLGGLYSGIVLLILTLFI